MIHRISNPIDRCNLKFGEVGGLDGTTNGLFEGYAIVFNSPDKSGDIVLPGAFTKTLGDRVTPVKMFDQHDRKVPIGKWLTIEEDDTGLYVQGELTPGHSRANDVYASLRHGSMDGLSIGFRVKPDGKKDIAGGGRILSEIELVEISPVTLPLAEDAVISQVKSDDIMDIESIRDCELFLRDAGLSRSMAKAFISQSRPLYQREVDAEHERKEAQRAALKWLHNLTDKR